jgi:hypothetical protein
MQLASLVHPFVPPRVHHLFLLVLFVVLERLTHSLAMGTSARRKRRHFG